MEHTACAQAIQSYDKLGWRRWGSSYYPYRLSLSYQSTSLLLVRAEAQGHGGSVSFSCAAPPHQAITAHRSFWFAPRRRGHGALFSFCAYILTLPDAPQITLFLGAQRRGGTEVPSLFLAMRHRIRPSPHIAHFRSRRGAVARRFRLFFLRCATTSGHHRTSLLLVRAEAQGHGGSVSFS